MEDVRVRFEEKVDRSDSHHLWTGSKSGRGVGRLRVDGRLMSAPDVAWRLRFGEPPEGATVLGCPDMRACVHPDHLRLAGNRPTVPAGRGRKGSGTIAARPNGTWKITVSAGNDDRGERRRTSRTVHGSKAEATRELAVLTAEVGDGHNLPNRAGNGLTVDGLVEWYLTFARDDRGLEHSTLTGYEDAYKTWIKPYLGSKRAALVQHGDLDKTFGRMRRAGLSHSRMNNARAVLSGAYKWGKRDRKVPTNPVDRFELPKSMQSKKPSRTPELDDLLRLLDGAEEHDPCLAPVLKLGATTGMRRGELAGLRRDRLHLDRRELDVDTAVNDAGGVVVEKRTKTQRDRVVSIDEATVSMLRAHLTEMDDRARLCGTTVSRDAFVFSLDPAGRLPMRPEFMTRRMRVLRLKLGIELGEFDATILALRKWTSSELMDAGFNPSAVSDRQGHTVQTMLHHYSSRRRSADRAAADHLGARVHGQTSDPPPSAPGR